MSQQMLNTDHQTDTPHFLQSRLFWYVLYSFVKYDRRIVITPVDKIVNHNWDNRNAGFT